MTPTFCKAVESNVENLEELLASHLANGYVEIIPPTGGQYGLYFDIRKKKLCASHPGEQPILLTTKNIGNYFALDKVTDAVYRNLDMRYGDKKVPLVILSELS